MIHILKNTNKNKKFLKNDENDKKTLYLHAGCLNLKMDKMQKMTPIGNYWLRKLGRHNQELFISFLAKFKNCDAATNRKLQKNLILLYTFACNFLNNWRIRKNSKFTRKLIKRPKPRCFLMTPIMNSGSEMTPKIFLRHPGF